MSDTAPLDFGAISHGGLASARPPLPAAVLAFASPIQGGKTTISKKVAERLGSPRVSFGEYLRGVARERGLGITRDSLRGLGEYLLSQDIRQFCEEVLSQRPCEWGRPLIVDGVRHAEVLDLICELFVPAPVYLVYIDIDRALQRSRLASDPLSFGISLEELENHPTEQQVRSKLMGRADVVLDGEGDPDESASSVVEFLYSRTPREPSATRL